MTEMISYSFSELSCFTICFLGRRSPRRFIFSKEFELAPIESTFEQPQTELPWWLGWKVYLILSACGIASIFISMILKPSSVFFGYGMWFPSRLLILPIILRILLVVIHSWRQWIVTPFQSKFLTWIYRAGFGVVFSGLIVNTFLLIAFYKERQLGMGALMFLIPLWIYFIGYPIMIFPLIFGKSKDLNVKRLNTLILLVFTIVFFYMP